MQHSEPGPAMTAEHLIFSVIGSPIGSNTYVPRPEEVDAQFQHAFKNRVGLLFLDRCVALGVPLSDDMQVQFDRLQERRSRTMDVIVRLARALNEVAAGEWAIFKSIKPFLSTPNDTDWLPFDRQRHEALCDHLQKSGFRMLETAPLQTTLVEETGLGHVHSDKRGGVYYIDCYKAPGADYFIYLDPAKLRRHVTVIDIAGVPVPMLNSMAELTATLIHNVFPEKTYSLESYYLILAYLEDIQKNGQLEEFVDTIRENFADRAMSANLSVTSALHQHYFGEKLPILEDLLDVFGSERDESSNFTRSGCALPYNFSNGCFWRVFMSKLREPIALRSALVQAVHMLNPIFFFDVVQIIWKRTRGTGIYKQM